MRCKLKAERWCWQQRVADRHLDNQQAEQAQISHQQHTALHTREQMGFEVKETGPNLCVAHVGAHESYDMQHMRQP
jgi:hypothetical protein